MTVTVVTVCFNSAEAIQSCYITAATNTVDVGPGMPDAVFVLDFLTGRLTGALKSKDTALMAVALRATIARSTIEPACTAEVTSTDVVVAAANGPAEPTGAAMPGALAEVIAASVHAVPSVPATS